MRAIHDLRRAELAEAALSVFLAEGAAGMTLDRVARAAGASKGIVLHYYDSKEALTARVLRDVLALLRAEVCAALTGAKGARARLETLLSFAFAEALFTPDYARAWLSVMAEAPRSEVHARFRRLHLRRRRSILVAGLRPLVGRIEAPPVAESLSALIDGLWLTRATDPGAITPQRAAALARTHLEESLAFL